MEKPPRGVHELPAQRDDSLTFKLLLGANTILLALILMFALHAHREVSFGAGVFHDALDIVTSPKPSPQVIQRAAGALRDLSDTFFFGSVNGSVATFALQLLHSDIGGIAGQVSNFADRVFRAFNVPPPTTCEQMVRCQQGGELFCPNGERRWCNYAGQDVNCASLECVAPHVAHVASLISSVAGKIKLVRPYPVNSSNSPAAFSDGIFRLDLLLDWVNSQLDASDWVTAGRACQNVAAQVRTIDWTGMYIDDRGRRQNWNENKRVRDGVDYVLQVCDNIVNIAPYMRKIQDDAAPGTNTKASK